MSNSDSDLLQKYILEDSQDAFAELVRRHLGLVYSVAARQMGTNALAEDVAQSVFLDLARQARSLKSGGTLTAWLHKVACRTAIDMGRKESRRMTREREAVNITLPTPSEWAQIEPSLDEALGSLGEEDRASLILRYFEKRSLREIAGIMSVSEDAAQKRVGRATERLRRFFARRSITIGAGALTSAISLNAVQSAPLSLVASISSKASAGLITTGILGVSKILTMTTLQKAIIVATLTVSVGAGVYEARRAAAVSEELRTVRQQASDEQRRAALAAANFQQQNSRLLGEIADLQKSAAELAQWRAAGDAAANDPTQAAMSSWLSRAAQLQQRLRQTPSLGIPEMEYATDQDWLEVTRDHQLQSEDDYRETFGRLRRIVETRFATKANRALLDYLKANNGRFPTDLTQLLTCFGEPVAPEILGRWKIGSLKAMGILLPKEWGDGVITRPNAVDPEYDSYVGIVGRKGIVESNHFDPTWKSLTGVLDAYRAANPGKKFKGISEHYAELQTYAVTADQQAALRKWKRTNAD